MLLSPRLQIGTEIEFVMADPEVVETNSRLRLRPGEVIGLVAGQTVSAGLDGVLRGLIRPGTEVAKGVKLGDIDPRGRREYCDTISDKARSIAGAVLEAIMRELNRPVAAAPC
jgi:hypothetical protein